MPVIEKKEARASIAPEPRRLTGTTPSQLRAVPRLDFGVERIHAPEPVAPEKVEAVRDVDGMGYRVGKRVCDVAIAGAAVTVGLPVMGLLALLIKLEDGGPVFYRQFRVGRNGDIIPFYKFRSMCVNADAIRHELLDESDAVGAAFKMKKDPRVTRVGRIMRKLSLDELPQLFSVLVGHMTVVGPRPHLCEEVATYNDRQRRRLNVKPGLLCLREIKGRSNLDFERWVEMDLEYIESRGFLMDAKIVLLAVPAILKGEGAY